MARPPHSASSALRRGAWLRYTIPMTLLLLGSVGFGLYRVAVPPNEEASRQSARLRNSLLARVGQASDFSWSPESRPPDFRWESPTAAARALRSLSPGLTAAGSKTLPDFRLALRIAEHLKSGPEGGGPIQGPTEEAYRRIVGDGLGWCSDYTQVFNGIATKLGLPAREWGMSFDGYGGDGHAFNEVFDAGRGQWVFIDSFYSFYVRDRRSGQPISVMELRSALLGEDAGASLEAVPIVEERFGFKSPEAALDYYRDGADQLYLWWGNDVFTYDAHPVVRGLAFLPGSLAQAASIMAGVHPGIRLVASETNEALVRSLLRLRRRLLGLLLVATALAIALLGQVGLALLRLRWKRAT